MATQDLVVGDLVHLKLGDRVPADVRVLVSYQAKARGSTQQHTRHCHTWQHTTTHGRPSPRYPPLTTIVLYLFLTMAVVCALCVCFVCSVCALCACCV